LSGYRAPEGAALSRGPDRRRYVSNIFNTKGIHVAIVHGSEIYDLAGKKIYDLKGLRIYRLSGELVGHLSDASGSNKRLDRSTDGLFPGTTRRVEKAETEGTAAIVSSSLG
jgi:hypothetical protein